MTACPLRLDNFPAELPSAEEYPSSSSTSSSSSSSSFIKSLCVSPDGRRILVSSEDHRFMSWNVHDSLVHRTRYYYTSTSEQTAAATAATAESVVEDETMNPGTTSTSPSLLSPTINFSSGESIYDCCWYPLMNIDADENSCCFISTCRDLPIQLWDGNTGALRCSYVGYNTKDEIEAANCVTFNPAGDRIYSGSTRMIRCFDVSNPGRVCDELPTCKSRNDTEGQRGIVSVLKFNPDRSGAYAAGSYAYNINIYVEDMEGSALELRDIDFGVTCLQWSPCGCMLWAGGRAHHDLICWDLRHTRTELGRVQRPLSTNQRMQFDLDPWGKYLATGTQDGKVLLYDTTTFELVATQTHTNGECIHTTAFHPYSSLLFTSTGSRHFEYDGCDDVDTSDEEDMGIMNDAMPLSNRNDDQLTLSTNSTKQHNKLLSSKIVPRSGVQVWTLDRLSMVVPSPDDMIITDEEKQ